MVDPNTSETTFQPRRRDTDLSALDGVRFFHYTDDAGHKAIRAHPDWTFRAGQPPGSHPFGAYFTTLAPGTRHLAKRLRVPRTKLEYVFAFVGGDGLKPLRGGRGAYVFYSEWDYVVSESRQRYSGPTGEFPGNEE